MNTNQLIVLWYGGLTFIGCWLSGVSGGITLAVGVGVLLLLVLSGWHHSHHVNRHKVLVAIMLPSLLAGILAFVMDTTEYDVGYPQESVFSTVPASEVALSNPSFKHRWFLDRLSGRIKNNSSKTLNSLKLNVSLVGAAGPLEDFDVTLKNLNIPPGQTQSFSQTVGDPKARFQKNVKFTYQVLGGVGR